MLGLAKNNTPTYDYYSEEDGTDPVTLAVDLDQSGAPAQVASTVVTAYLIATTYKYTQVVVTPVTEDVGVDWQVSLTNNGADWAETVNVPDMDALLADVATPIYFRALAANDGSLPVSIKTACDIQITRKGSPQ